MELINSIQFKYRIRPNKRPGALGNLEGGAVNRILTN